MKKEISVKTLDNCTAQEVFDFVANHLLTQKESALEEAGCVYRTSETKKILKCAAGCLIPDDVYKPEIEGKTYCNVVDMLNLSPKHESLIINLQEIHDYHSPDKWKTKLLRLANRNKLEWNFKNS